MKNLSISLLLTCLMNCAFSQVKNGETVSDIKFELLNAPVKSISLNALKGKIVLIDFWATWCSPCVEAMPHLMELQAKYPNKLQVITITDEKAARIKQFLASRPSNLWGAIDTGNIAARAFPHQTIPHTVIISPEGKLMATTDPKLVTEAVIDSLLHQKEVHLADQRGILLESSDIVKTYFFATDTVKNKFIMQAGLQGSSSFSKTYPLDSVFKGRRITCVNFTLSGLYMAAYPGFPHRRTINRSGEKKDSPVYCLDLIVENKKDLLPTLRKELAKRFDLQAKIEQQTKDVYLLKITDKNKFAKVPINTSGKRTFMAKQGEIDQQYITMTDLGDYLENYGTGKLPVIDETLNKEHFDIRFSFQPEKPETLTAVLNDIGLSLERDTRKIDFLVLYK